MLLTTLGCGVDVETVILQPRRNSEEIPHKTWDSTVEDGGIAGKHMGVEHPGIIVLDNNWKQKENMRLASVAH
jgi:hypothetical protein